MGRLERDAVAFSACSPQKHPPRVRTRRDDGFFGGDGGIIPESTVVFLFFSSSACPPSSTHTHAPTPVQPFHPRRAARRIHLFSILRTAPVLRCLMSTLFLSASTLCIVCVSRQKRLPFLSLSMDSVMPSVATLSMPWVSLAAR